MVLLSSFIVRFLIFSVLDGGNFPEYFLLFVFFLVLFKVFVEQHPHNDGTFVGGRFSLDDILGKRHTGRCTAGTAVELRKTFRNGLDIGHHTESRRTVFGEEIVGIVFHFAFIVIFVRNILADRAVRRNRKIPFEDLESRLSNVRICRR